MGRDDPATPRALQLQALENKGFYKMGAFLMLQSFKLPLSKMGRVVSGVLSPNHTPRQTD
jgi:hypothetical protein